MSAVKRIVLDVLKPHEPNVLEFAQAIAGLGADYRVTLRVTEVDDKTQTTVIVIEADAIDFPQVIDTVSGLGGAVHSIDEVEVAGSPAARE